jgi:hypothetical protein
MVRDHLRKPMKFFQSPAIIMQCRIVYSRVSDQQRFVYETEKHFYYNCVKNTKGTKCIREISRPLKDQP